MFVTHYFYYLYDIKVLLVLFIIIKKPKDKHMKCQCKNHKCINQNITENINQTYKPCAMCDNKTLKKAIPLKRQIKLTKINTNYKRCPRCNKRHIDITMAHITKILIDENILPNTASIRKAGMPLITPAIPIKNPPYLNENSLVLINNQITKKVATKIYEEIPEIKAIIKGDVNKTIGQITEDDKIHNYDLLIGCPIRCDIQKTEVGLIPIYKDQSKIHIEYTHENSQKIQDVKKILNKYNHPTIIDAMCGPGTLGIYALKNNAKHVLFNDINSEATQTTKLNLEINQIPDDKYTILNKNLHELPEKIDEKYDIALLDAFPNINIESYITTLKKVADKIIII